ncbi:hypothetical protein FRB95_013550 [Tulasnella sp. JGI-2019a]|nr:hypothetical protein FRB95_013550 [Tulasnella sp. JGI-2019a]
MHMNQRNHCLLPTCLQIIRVQILSSYSLRVSSQSLSSNFYHHRIIRSQPQAPSNSLLAMTSLTPTVMCLQAPESRTSCNGRQNPALAPNLDLGHPIHSADRISNMQARYCLSIEGTYLALMIWQSANPSPP